MTVAGLRWPVEEEFQIGKDQFGLDHSQVRLQHALERHIALAMMALAICATTAAAMRDKTATLPPAPTDLDQEPPENPGLIALTVAEIRRLLVSFASNNHPRDHQLWWNWWRRRHQARARWFHQRTRLQTEPWLTQPLSGHEVRLPYYMLDTAWPINGLMLVFLTPPEA